MLTMDATTLANGGRVWAIEFDTEYGHVQTFGEAEVHYYLPRRGNGATLESGATGGCYSEPQVLGDVEIWNAEEHYLAVFSDQAAMLAGGAQLAAAWGNDLPIGIYRVIG